ncbi:NTP transferase domain-containing protein [Gleimia hominis]|uniref:NTP transferase domain-containing protein n=1 Tax=Gleimia hominis TaxID=595468 RepID=UPI0026CA93CF
MTTPSAVIILAAGQGTRMKSATPKVLHTMCGLPLVGHAIDAAEESGAEHTVVVVRHQREAVANAVQELKPDAIIADQDAVPGTGRAVWCGMQELSKHASLQGTILVISADVPLLEGDTIRELTRMHEESKRAVTVVTTVVDDPTGYGRIIRDGETVTAIVEHRDATAQQREIKEMNAGIYAFDAQFLQEALQGLEQNNDQGEVYLTDTIALAKQHGGAGAYLLKDTWQAQGCNDRAQLAQLRDEMNRRILRKHMLSGVAIISPNETSIDKDVAIAPDVTIEPGCVLEGTTIVEPFATIGPHTTLRNTRVEEGAVLPHVFAYDTTIAAGTVAPAFSEFKDSDPQ